MTDLEDNRPPSLISKALQVAEKNHSGQPDKGGRAYIGHVLRVAGGAAVVADPSNAEDALIVGLLHDVVEDTDVTLDDLRNEGFPEHIVAAVDAISRRKPPKHDERETDSAYLDRIKANPLARFVKAADSLDNSDERRLQVVADENVRAKLRAKYKGYLETLEHLPEDS